MQIKTERIKAAAAAIALGAAMIGGVVAASRPTSPNPVACAHSQAAAHAATPALENAAPNSAVHCATPVAGTPGADGSPSAATPTK